MTFANCPRNKPFSKASSPLSDDLRIFNTFLAAKAGNIGPEIARLKPCPFKTTMIRLISKARTLHFSLNFKCIALPITGP